MREMGGRNFRAAVPWKTMFPTESFELAERIGFSDAMAHKIKIAIQQVTKLTRSQK